MSSPLVQDQDQDDLDDGGHAVGRAVGPSQNVPAFQRGGGAVFAWCTVGAWCRLAPGFELASLLRPARRRPYRSDTFVRIWEEVTRAFLGPTRATGSRDRTDHCGGDVSGEDGLSWTRSRWPKR
ncbi:hypothetical protein GCM10010411_90800 [Actinomadura fulvescens]|uniref:Uncharacterized protein n=1 Tax=Actinomadura fulvescens TaxID=46160 RepID=A0ABP6D6M8_9ACTN